MRAAARGTPIMQRAQQNIEYNFRARIPAVPMQGAQMQQWPSRKPVQRAEMQRFQGGPGQPQQKPLAYPYWNSGATSRELATTENIDINGCGPAGDITDTALTVVDWMFPQVGVKIDCSTCTSVELKYDGNTYADVDVCDFGKNNCNSVRICIYYVVQGILESIWVG